MNARCYRVAGVVSLVLVSGIWCDKAQGQSGRAKRTFDPRVQQALEQIGWKYEVDSDADFKLVFRYPNDGGRTQVVFINSRTTNLGTMGIRHVWSPAIASPSPFTEDVLNDLLEENGKTKVGAWAVKKSRQGYLAAFVAGIHAEADEKTLADVVRAVATTADEKEKQVTGKDDM